MRRSFWLRPGGPIALAAAGCAACCAIPIVGIALGAGAAASLAAVIEPLAGVLMAAGAVLAVLLLVRWQRARRAGAACAIDRSCGCGPPTVGGGDVLVDPVQRP